MSAGPLLTSASRVRNVGLEGEHPDNIVADIARRGKLPARIIVVANEKGGVGKSTIAFHLAVGLLHRGHSVAAIDLDRRQQTLSRVLGYRDGTICRLKAPLKSPRHAVLQVPSGAMLCQEMMRIGSACDYIVIDVPGDDSAIARRALALADILVTPISSSFVDLDLLARVHPLTLDIVSPGCFATAVNEIRQARLRQGLGGIDWIVLENRLRRETSHNRDRVEAALRTIAPEAGFRMTKGLAERVAYRDLFLMGLTHLDLKALPALPFPNSRVVQEIRNLVATVEETPADRRCLVNA